MPERFGCEITPATATQQTFSRKRLRRIAWIATWRRSAWSARQMRRQRS